MVLGGKLIYMAGRLRVGNQETRLGKGVRRPDVRKGAPAALRYPQAGILSIPALAEVGIGRVVIVVGIGAAPMTAQEAHIIH